MEGYIQIEECERVEEELEALAGLLVNVVDEGASVGFLPPLSMEAAQAYWRSLTTPSIMLFIAKTEGEIAGTVQLHLAEKENGRHRAEICKLMTHPGRRKMGIGRLLMKKAEERAKELNRALLVLDTRDGDPSNRLYRSAGYIEAGRIPAYAESADGKLDTSIFYYKFI